MKRILSIGLMLVVFAGILYACNLGSSPEEPQGALPENTTALGLAVQAGNGVYSAVGQVITYQYVVSNTGTTAYTGPVTITDNKVAVNCPAVNTVGNMNDDLDPTESIICTSAYAITQADLNAGTVTSNATASISGVNSNTVSTSVPMTLLRVLELASSANPITYSQAGQVITFTYSIKNTGTTPLGPAQFIVHTDLVGNINCGGPDTALAAGQSITCNGAYNITEADRNVTQLVFTTVASGAGAANIQPAVATVTNAVPVHLPSGTLTPGSTIQHHVVQGEWMLQIARCYGANFNAVRNANPQVIDPALIWPVNVLTIPNIGSNGAVYGPPCITFYTVVAGDTWNSIALKFNADMDVLLEANKGIALAAGVKLRIPLNSAGGTPQHPIATQPTPIQPIRINFPAGSKSVTLSGTVTVARIKDRYIFTALQGQLLTVNLTATTGGLELAILSVSGTVLKAQNATLTYNGAIPANGDYYIDVVNVTSTDRPYTLRVDLTTTQPPTTIPPTAQPPATTVERVADINPGPADGNPAHLEPFNNVLYFSAKGLDNVGVELWKYDAAANSMGLVKDIYSGPESSNPSHLAVYNNLLYFSANGNDGAGVELWRFNGTDAGRLTDINSGPADANPSYMTEYNGSLYFSANGSDGAGVELWKTDGTNSSRVTDIYAGAGDSNPSYLAVYNGLLYFSAISNDSAGTELWKFDGTTPTRVSDINPGVGNANPSYLAVFNNLLYFSANGNDGAGTELWKYDGTNVSRAADINAGSGDSNPAFLTVFAGELHFSANGNDGAGIELWKFNGTTASRAADVNKSGDSLPSYLSVYNNQLYFQANGGDGAGRELWKYKGP